jgi:GNAT superfamily N-acetyltransferase
MDSFEIHAILPADQSFIAELLQQHWGDRKVVSRGKVHDAALLPGLIAERDGSPVGLITLHYEGNACEVVTLDAFVAREGIGSALLRKAQEEAVARGYNRFWLITTNDNIDALAFYQKCGFRMVAVHPDAVSEARKLKPQIPLMTDNGILILDEIEMALNFSR